jgi:hypothetical protein
MSEPPFDLKIAVLESLNVVLLEDVGSLMSLLSNCKIYYGPMTRQKMGEKMAEICLSLIGSISLITVSYKT